MKQIAFICVFSERQEIRQFHALSHKAVYLALQKTALFCHSDLHYQLYSCRPPDDIRAWSGSADFCIFYFLCSTQEIADFFSANFRNMKQALYLLNSSYYDTKGKVLHFQNIYRLPARCACAIPSNLAFQAAISNHKENQFFYLYNQKKLSNQNSEFLEQMRNIHLLTAAYMNGEHL